MEVGAPVWVRDKDGDEAWVAGTVLEKSSGSPCKVQIEVDEEFSEEPLTFTFSADDGYELEDLKLANEEEMDYVEDLISLPHLHEAAILHSLCKRFEKGEIYTFTANAILLAVNPFKRLPCYSQDILMEYFNNGFMKQQGIEPAKPLGPHVFAIADSAYRDMMQGIHAGKAAGMGPVNQSILISGESGAGKTESTKFVMRYLTTVGNGGEGVELEKGSIMDRVLQSNPILEAFGNARTIRNDNSSRFGKFIELMFDRRGSLLGAGIETYLLEKVRLPTQSENERNFHIFYQMCKGGDDDERDRWELQGPEEYHFVNQGECYDLRRVEDEDEFEKTKAALSTMGFEASSVETIFDIVAGLIHMGELEFEAHDEDESAMLSEEEENLECVERVCRLCSLPKDGLVRALTSKTIEVGPRREKTTIKLKDHQAYDARDALAKAFYGQLFNWLVATVNTHIKCDKKDVKASVGVLDIFGFECFEHNSFEQLCINYTNETLQQQFNQFVFKMEQKEYSKEGIEWSFVEFPDNQDCLDLIEGKQKGLLTMLDDECRMGIRGTDANYASRLYKEHTETPRFEADSAMMTKLCFAVNHYAGQVEYHVDTFCDKNKDELPKESDELFASSPNPFVVHLFNPDKGKKAKAKGKKPTAQKKDTSQAGIAGLKPTVGTQFREQLVNLMEMIRQTRPHYIRCIKPNDNAEPDEVSRVRVMEQLRYGGVLEAVRVARSGYPVRLPHKDFYARYRCLVALDPKIKKSKYPIHVGNKGASTAQKMCKELVKNVLVPAMVSKKNISEDTLQFGKSKVFLRKNAHDFLEMLRSHRITEAAVTMQRMARGFVYRSVFSTTRNAIVLIQRMARGMMARKRVEHMRRMRAALRIQTAFRRHSARRKYLMLKGAALALQCATRRTIAVAIHRELKRQHRATKLQSWQRMLGPWKAYRKLKSASIALQCRLRQKIAYAELRELRIKAKDVGNLKEENIMLKAQILEMRERAAGAAAEAGNNQLSTALQEAADLRSEVEKLTARVGELEGQVADEQAAKAKAEKAAAAAEAKAAGAAGAAKAAGDAAAAGDNESESLRAKIAELEAALKEEKRASAAALVEADAAAVEAAAASATAIAAAAAAAVVAPAAPAPARAASVEITNSNGSEVESMRAAIVELESALAGEKEKVSAAEAAAAVAVAAAAATEGPSAARSSVEPIPDNGTTAAAEADGLLRVRVAELEAALKIKDDELAAAVAVAAAAAIEGSSAVRSFVEPVPDNGTTAAAEADGLLRVRVAELEAALENKDEELAASKAAAAIAAADADDAGAVLEGVPSEGVAAGYQLLRKQVSELEDLLAAENKLASEANFAANAAKAKADAAEAAKREAEAVAATAEAKAAAAGGGGSGTRSSSGGYEGGGQALRGRVASLEKALMEAKASAKIEVEAARASAARSAAEAMSRPMDSGEDGDVESMREVLMELEAQLSRERQERERAVEERKMSEELVTHLSKQLKSRAYAAAAEVAEFGVLGDEGVLENGVANERGELDDGDSEEERMIGSLSRVLDEEREARRNAEEENARLRNVADAAADSERAHAKVVQSLTLELEEARKAKKKAEQSAAIATASAAALVASSDTSRPRPAPENKPRTPTPGWRSAIHGALETGIVSRVESFGANGHLNAGGSSHPSSPGSNVSGLTNPSTKPSQLHTNAVLEFEERLEAIRTGLSQGVDCHVWEEKTRRAEAIMSATEGDSGSSKLTFAAKGTYLIWRAPVRPIPLDSNLKVSLGHGDLHGLSNEDDSTFLTVTVGAQGQDEGRTIIIQVADKEMRNDLVSSLRRLLTQAKVGAMAAKMRGPRSRRPGSGSGGITGSGSGSGTGERPGVSRRVSVFDLGGGSRLPPSLSSPPTRGPRATLSSAMSFPAHSGSGGFGGGGTPNGDRSPSMGTVVALGSHRKIDRTGGEDPEMVDLLRNQLEQLAMSKESELNAKEVELQEARLSSERTMVQMMELTNEVNTKQDEIRMLKRQAAEAVEDMEEMRRTHKDNANVSMQLLKKMEGLQFDNEELRHETEVLRNQVAVFYNEARLAREGRDGPHENSPSRPISLSSSREDGMPASPSGSLSSFTSGVSHAGGNDG